MREAIDIHGHFGEYDRGLGALTDRCMSASADEVCARAVAAGIRMTVVSATPSFMPYGGDVIRGNELSVQAVEENAHFRFWAVLDPRRAETFEQIDTLLKHPKCAGIKLHPHAHFYEIAAYGAAAFELAAAHDALVLVHSGDPGSYPEDFLPFANQHPNIRLILAHLGNSDDGSMGRQVSAIRHSRHQNIYVDTSSARSMASGLIEWAVDKVGADRILFGTDTPIYFVAAQKARIEYAGISDAAKAAILYENAERLLGLDSISSGDALARMRAADTRS